MKCWALLIPVGNYVHFPAAVLRLAVQEFSVSDEDARAELDVLCLIVFVIKPPAPKSGTYTDSG